MLTCAAYCCGYQPGAGACARAAPARMKVDRAQAQLSVGFVFDGIWSSHSNYRAKDFRRLMTQEQWTRVDEYVNHLMLSSDPVLDAALAASNAAGLPAINVAPNQGKFLSLLAQMQGASRILEVGTLAGYSTIRLARALPSNGRLVTLELDPKHAQVARGNIERAGLTSLVELRVGKALDSLAALVSEGVPPFDFVFIDADKPTIPDYFAWSLRLTRPGSVIVVDNVIRKGNVIDAASTDANVQGVRRFNELVAKTPTVSGTTLQTVGSKGYDGFALLRVTSLR